MKGSIGINKGVSLPIHFSCGSHNVSRENERVPVLQDVVTP